MDRCLENENPVIAQRADACLDLVCEHDRQADGDGDGEGRVQAAPCSRSMRDSEKTELSTGAMEAELPVALHAMGSLEQATALYKRGEARHRLRFR